MSFFRKNWYYVGGVLFMALALVLISFWNDIGVLRRLMLMSFMALLVHQSEEYAWPSGFPAVMNIAWEPCGGMTDRCPLNRNSALYVNVIFAYPFYILPIIFPSLIWLGLAQVLFGMTQFFFHGILINKKMHSLYNPGLFSVLFLHWPIGICYIWYVTVNGLTQRWTWPVAVVTTGAAAFFGVKMLLRLLKDPNSPYPFSDKEMARFHVKDKIERLKAKTI